MSSCSVSSSSRVLPSSPGATHGFRASWWLLQRDLLRPVWGGPRGRPRLREYRPTQHMWTRLQLSGPAGAACGSRAPPVGPGLCLGSSSAAQRAPRAPLKPSFVGVKQPSGFLAGNTSQVCRVRLAWTVLEGGRDEAGLVRLKEISSFNKNKMSQVFWKWVECTWLI